MASSSECSEQSSGSEQNSSVGIRIVREHSHMLGAALPSTGLHEVPAHWIRVFLGMTYRVTNSPNCMSGLKTG